MPLETATPKHKRDGRETAGADFHARRAAPRGRRVSTPGISLPNRAAGSHPGSVQLAG